MDPCEIKEHQISQQPSAVINVDRGSKIWVEDEQLAWVAAEVVDIQNQHVRARTEKGKTMVVVPISRVYLRDVNVSPRGQDDMTKLAYLHEPGVLYNLASRYELNEIYTYTGNILIAVNPFMKLPHLYDLHMMDQYRGAIFGELSPHVFAIADSAYRAMIYKNQNQVILVSGESGAGKTETTKLIMRYLAFVGGRAGRPGNDGRTVEQQVLESNPLLEAFGNAKTVRNDNSSRFGKFVEIQFNSIGKISGAAIRTYLLERSRVVKLNNEERNYHCFYQLCSSAIDAKKYKLIDPRKFHYLNQSKCFFLSGVDDGLEYSRTRRAMTIVGISSEEQDAIFRILAAILHLGNIEFEPGKEHDSSLPKHDQSYFHLQTAAELLMCNAENLKDTLCTRVIIAHGEVIKKMLDPETAITNRDALSKTIYSHLFDWLVDKINKSIGQDMESQAQIGLLDIYGFESFPNNSFEQFCINLANEKLQQHFNEHALKLEQEEYSNEGIDWSYIEYIDNQDVLELIEKRPMGIIALLDEACMFPKSTNETFASKLFHAFKNNERFRKPKLSPTDFIISHYAGEVIYQTDLFIDKNKDFVIVEHQALLESSKDPFVCELFTSRTDHKMKPSYKFSSVATRFKQQLQLLMETLSSSEPHYIRCVKPNSDNKPGKFENQSVLHQLRCAGVLEAVRISCAGHPTRTPYNEFLNRFGFLASNVISGYADRRTATEKLLEHMKITDYRLGMTKVFLRTGQMADLEAHRAEALSKAIKIIQQKTKSYLLRKKFLLIRSATLCIQAHWRGHLDRIVYKAKRKEAATILIQCFVRMWLARKTYVSLCRAAMRIQKHARIFLEQKRGINCLKTSPAVTIQVKTAESESEEVETAGLQHRFLKIEKYKQTELATRERTLTEMGKSKGAEFKGLQIALIEMTESKQADLARLQSALTEIEESKGAELERLQNALTEMEQSREVELKMLQNKLVEVEASKIAELEMLQTALLEMEERKISEITRLQCKLQIKEAELANLGRMEMAVLQTELDKTRETEECQELVLFEMEKSKQKELAGVEATVIEMDESKGSELTRLQSALIEMEKSKGEEVARLEAALLRMEESKDAEVAELQAALLEMEELKREEISRMQSAFLQTEEKHSAELARLQNTIHEMEEKKEAELARLRNALFEMQQQADSMGILILKERETNKMLSIQLASLIKIRPLLEVTEAKAYQLAKENGHLRILKDIHENKLLEAEKELLNARKDSEQKVQRSNEADSRMDKVQETLDRLEEKIEYMELENQSLRRQAHIFSPNGRNDHVMSLRQRTRSNCSFDSESISADEQLIIKISPERYCGTNYMQDTPERQCATNQDQRSLFTSPAQSFSTVPHVIHHSEHRQQRLFPENRLENQDILVDLITQDIGFSNGIPIVACTIYKCLSHWNAFQSERTNIFDRLAQTIGACIEAQERNDVLSYWLSNVSTLLHLGHHYMKPREAPSTPITPNTPRRLGLLSRMTNSFRSPSRFKRFHVKRGLSSLDSLRQVEIKTPAVVFKQQLIIFVEKLYGLLRDNLKKDISPLLTACIQAPRASQSKVQPLGPYTISSLAHSLATTDWSRITDCLNSLFIKLHANHVPPFFVCKIFTQIFSFINAQLFNSLLLRRECCSFSNGEYLRAGLAELETWICKISQEYAGDSWEELRLIRQAVAFLVIHQKPQRTFEEIRQDLCPGLSVQQLYRISTMYWDDKYGTHSVSYEVIACMKKHMAEESKKSSGSSFLLDDDSSIPFSVEEILLSMPHVDPTAIEYPHQLLMRETSSIPSPTHSHNQYSQ